MERWRRSTPAPAKPSLASVFGSKRLQVNSANCIQALSCRSSLRAVGTHARMQKKATSIWLLEHTYEWERVIGSEPCRAMAALCARWSECINEGYDFILGCHTAFLSQLN